MNRTRLFPLAAICLAVVGCGGDADGDVTPVYAAVLQHEMTLHKKGVDIYLSIDHQDPDPVLLKDLQKTFPAIQPRSNAPKDGSVLGAGLSELKWINRGTAEVRYGFSNGKDGRVVRHRVEKKDGVWIVAKSTTEASS